MASIDSLDSYLSHSKDAIQKILLYTTEGIAVIGEDETVEYVNNRLCQLVGRPQNEILGQSFKNFIHPDSRETVFGRFNDRLRGEAGDSLYRMRILHSSKGARDVQVRTNILTNGRNRIRILAQLVDITDEMRIMQALTESTLKFETLVDTMNEGLGVIDDKGVFVHANAALCTMLGYTENELVGKPTSEVLHGLTTERVFEKIRKRIAGISSRYETHLIHKSGKLIPALSSASPIFNDDGEYIGSFAVFMDTSVQMTVKKQLQHARDRALLYLDYMNHDIRNHLQEIQVAAELLKNGTTGDWANRLLGDILNAVSKSTEVIAETRAIEELAQLPLTDRLLDEAVRETVLAAIAAFDDIHFQMSMQVAGAKVLADDYLEILISDLVANACKHCSNDGNGAVSICLTRSNGMYELYVRDNGQWASNWDKESSFDSTVRSRYPILHLAHRMVRKYSGTFEVAFNSKNTSHESCVKITLPSRS